jgi:hypothetical protein
LLQCNGLDANGTCGWGQWQLGVLCSRNQDLDTYNLDLEDNLK